MERALVLLSGGIDSAVSLAIAINKYGESNVETITFDYGQRNNNEIKFSKLLSKHYKVKNVLINVSNLFQYSNSSLLKHSTKKLSYDTYEKQIENKNAKDDVGTVVPFRNGLFLSIAASYAISQNIDYIYYGIHYEVGVAHSLYPDCSEDFNQAINDAIFIGSGKKVSVIAPLVKKTKKEIIKLGIDYNVPFEKTWTCYDNKNLACGKCNSCQDRIKAFRENNVMDPIEYE